MNINFNELYNLILTEKSNFNDQSSEEIRKSISISKYNYSHFPDADKVSMC